MLIGGDEREIFYLNFSILNISNPKLSLFLKRINGALKHNFRRFFFVQRLIDYEKKKYR